MTAKKNDTSAIEKNVETSVKTTVHKLVESLKKRTKSHEFSRDISTFSSDDRTQSDVWSSISTGSMGIDCLLIGGSDPVPKHILPYSDIIEIGGRNHTGKTSLSLQIAGQAQKDGAIVLYCDTERILNRGYAESLNVDYDALVLAYPETIEDVEVIFHNYLDSHQEVFNDMKVLPPICYVLDSHADLTCLDEENRPLGKGPKVMAFPAAANRIWRRAHKLLKKHRVLTVVTNHLYSTTEQADPYVTPGGDKLKFLAAYRLILTPLAMIIETEDGGSGNSVIGRMIKVEQVKNKYTGRIRTARLPVLYGRGFDDDYLVFKTSQDIGLTTSSGAWRSTKFPEGEAVKFQGWGGFQKVVVKDKRYPKLKQLVKEHLLQ